MEVIRNSFDEIDVDLLDIMAARKCCGKARSESSILHEFLKIILR